MEKPVITWKRRGRDWTAIVSYPEEERLAADERAQAMRAANSQMLGLMMVPQPWVCPCCGRPDGYGPAGYGIRPQVGNILGGAFGGLGL